MRKWRVVVPLLIVVVLGTAIFKKKEADLPAYQYHSVRYAQTNEYGRPYLGALVYMSSDKYAEPLLLIGTAERILTPNGWTTNTTSYSRTFILPEYSWMKWVIILPNDAQRWQVGHIVCRGRVLQYLRSGSNSGWRRHALNIFAKFRSSRETFSNNHRGAVIIWGPEMEAATWMRWHPVEAVYPKIPYRAIEPERDGL